MYIYTAEQRARFVREPVYRGATRPVSRLTRVRHHRVAPLPSVGDGNSLRGCRGLGPSTIRMHAPFMVSVLIEPWYQSKPPVHVPLHLEDGFLPQVRVIGNPHLRVRGQTPVYGAIEVPMHSASQCRRAMSCGRLFPCVVFCAAQGGTRRRPPVIGVPKGVASLRGLGG